MAAGIAAAFRDDTLDLVEKITANAPSDPLAVAEDEAFWSQIQEAFMLDRNLINFNNGGCSPSPRVVHEVLKRQLDHSNQGPSYYMWRDLEPEIEATRRKLAGFFGADPEEIAITRNASESLEALLFGIDLEPGDEILTTTMDYPRMITTIKQRERRDRVKMVQVDPPAVPKNAKDLVDSVEKGITGKTKVILCSHVSFLNGQIYPIRSICELGKKRGIPVIVDGAHAFSQFPMSADGLGCEFYGTSLHKWTLAPVGTGMLFIKKNRIKDIWPLFAATDAQDENIRKFEEIGTHPAANHGAILEAVTFTEMLGIERKAARYRALRKRWTEKLLNEPKIAFHTNLNPEHSCAITTVEVKGVSISDLVTYLQTKHNIFVVGIDHPQFKGIRVTPNVYTTFQEIDRFADAMLTAATKGIA